MIEIPVDNVIDTTENCRYCLMCRHMCPVGNVTHLETLTPHGWAQLIASERRGLLNWADTTVDRLYKCADCGSCRSHCVTDQPLPDAIAAARAQVVERGLAPRAVYEVADRLKKWENVFSDTSPVSAEGTGDVALFVGDEAWHTAPDAVKSVQNVLRFAGVTPVLVGCGRNDGYAASALGLSDVAGDLARANLAEIIRTRAGRLLVFSPGHYYTLTRLYKDRLGVSQPDGLEVREVTDFLAEQQERGHLKLNRSDDETPYAYVDPSHTVRVLTRHGAPRNLLKAVWSGPQIELFWRGDRAYPAGNIALQFTHPELADTLTRARLEDAQNAGLSRVVTDDPGALAHLRLHAAEYGVEVRFLYDILGGGMGNGEL